MAKLIRIDNIRSDVKGTVKIEEYMFYCPGCNCSHAYITDNGGNNKIPRWEFNGDTENPVFRPSLLYKKNGVVECHLFVGGRNGNLPGKIEYLNDCNHDLKGQIVDMVDV